MGNALSPINEERRLPQPQTPIEYALIRHCKRPPRFVGSREHLSLLQIVQRVFDTFLMTIIQGALFWFSANIYAIGFCVGVIWDDSCHYAIERIKAVWHNFTVLQKCLATLAGLVSFPVVLITVYFLNAVNVGSHFSHESGYDKT